MITYEQGIRLLKKYNLNDNVTNHSIAVGNTCFLIATNIIKNNKGPTVTIDGISYDISKLDPEYVKVAGLLHDIGRCRTNSWEHARESEKILVEEGDPELGRIVGAHGDFILPEKHVNDFDLYQKIVIYADSITLYSILSLDERFEGVLERRRSAGLLKEEGMIKDSIKKHQILETQMRQLMGNPIN
ncbi:HD domain-containing protein [Candidatus Woesearchaeota archaeon]|nr:HD domain-containing protein [Candidatus Woesearchaeota archaeon]